jgi:hypothetical protein
VLGKVTAIADAADTADIALGMCVRGVASCYCSLHKQHDEKRQAKPPDQLSALESYSSSASWRGEAPGLAACMRPDRNGYRTRIKRRSRGPSNVLKHLSFHVLNVYVQQQLTTTTIWRDDDVVVRTEGYYFIWD